MIINSRYTTEDCQIIDIKKGKAGDIITQAQPLDAILAHCAMMKKETDNGFTKKRMMRLIAEIPSLTYAAHQDQWLRNPGSQKRWLKSDEGRPFLFVDRNSI